MELESVFARSGLLVLPFWLLMIVLPRWRWTQRIVASPLIAAPAALLYLVLVVPRLSTIFPAVTDATLTGIMALLGTPEGATIAWAHFLAFDLFVGRWAYLDSQARRVSAWLMAPVLFLVLMLGPLGFLLYLGLRALAPLLRRSRPALGERAIDLAAYGDATAEPSPASGPPPRQRGEHADSLVG